MAFLPALIGSLAGPLLGLFTGKGGGLKDEDLKTLSPEELSLHRAAGGKIDGPPGIDINLPSSESSLFQPAGLTFRNFASIENGLLNFNSGNADELRFVKDGGTTKNGQMIFSLTTTNNWIPFKQIRMNLLFQVQVEPFEQTYEVLHSNAVLGFSYQSAWGSKMSYLSAIKRCVISINGQQIYQNDTLDMDLEQIIQDEMDQGKLFGTTGLQHHFNLYNKKIWEDPSRCYPIGLEDFQEAMLEPQGPLENLANSIWMLDMPIPGPFNQSENLILGPGQKLTIAFHMNDELNKYTKDLYLAAKLRPNPYTNFLQWAKADARTPGVWTPLLTPSVSNSYGGAECRLHLISLENIELTCKQREFIPSVTMNLTGPVFRKETSWKYSVQMPVSVKTNYATAFKGNRNSKFIGDAAKNLPGAMVERLSQPFEALEWTSNYQATLPLSMELRILLSGEDLHPTGQPILSRYLTGALVITNMIIDGNPTGISQELAVQAFLQNPCFRSFYALQRHQLGWRKQFGQNPEAIDLEAAALARANHEYDNFYECDAMSLHGKVMPVPDASSTNFDKEFAQSSWDVKQWMRIKNWPALWVPLANRQASQTEQLPATSGTVTIQFSVPPNIWAKTYLARTWGGFPKPLENTAFLTSGLNDGLSLIVTYEHNNELLVNSLLTPPAEIIPSTTLRSRVNVI